MVKVVDKQRAREEERTRRETRTNKEAANRERRQTSQRRRDKRRRRERERAAEGERERKRFSDGCNQIVSRRSPLEREGKLAALHWPLHAVRTISQGRGPPIQPSALKVGVTHIHHAKSVATLTTIGLGRTPAAIFRGPLCLLLPLAIERRGGIGGFRGARQRAHRAIGHSGARGREGHQWTRKAEMCEQRKRS